MAAATLSSLNNLMKEILLGPPRIEAVPVTAWTCGKHRRPVRDKYEERCAHEALTGEACPDKWECPHVESVKIADGCAECKTSEYATVLDALTGEEVWKAKLFSTLGWEMNRPSILFDELMRGGDTEKT